ncbi:MAG: hypothetical protein QW733_03925 [Desulfurococcaceae archaeon]
MIDRGRVEEFCRFFMKERTRDASSFTPRHALAFALGKDKTKFFEYMNHISQKYIGKSLSQDDVLAVWLYILNHGGLTLELGQQKYHRIVFPSKHAYTVQVYTKSAELPTFLERLSAGIKGDKEYYIMFFYSETLKGSIYHAPTDHINPQQIKLISSSYPKDLKVSFWARGFLYKGFSRLEDALEFITQLHELRERTKEQTWLTLYKDSNIVIDFPPSGDYMRVDYRKISYEIAEEKYLPFKYVVFESISINDLMNFLGSKSYAVEYIERLLDFGEELLQQMQETFKKRKKDTSVKVKWKDSYEDIELSAYAGFFDGLGKEVEDKLREDIAKLLEEKNLYLSSFVKEKEVNSMRAISI